MAQPTRRLRVSQLFIVQNQIPAEFSSFIISFAFEFLCQLHNKSLTIKTLTIELKKGLLIQRYNTY